MIDANIFLFEEIVFMLNFALFWLWSMLVVANAPTLLL